MLIEFYRPLQSFVYQVDEVKPWQVLPVEMVAELCNRLTARLKFHTDMKRM
jgi:hypothetical protein